MVVLVVVLDAVQYQHVDASSASVLDVISKQLKMAPHRQGGAGKGVALRLMFLATALSGHQWRLTLSAAAALSRHQLNHVMTMLVMCHWSE